MNKNTKNTKIYNGAKISSKFDLSTIDKSYKSACIEYTSAHKTAVSEIAILKSTIKSAKSAVPIFTGITYNKDGYTSGQIDIMLSQKASNRQQVEILGKKISESADKIALIDKKVQSLGLYIIDSAIIGTVPGKDGQGNDYTNDQRKAWDFDKIIKSLYQNTDSGSFEKFSEFMHTQFERAFTNKVGTGLTDEISRILWDIKIAKTGKREYLTVSGAAKIKQKLYGCIGSIFEDRYNDIPEFKFDYSEINNNPTYVDIINALYDVNVEDTNK